jgi:hypothetical protein
VSETKGETLDPLDLERLRAIAEKARREKWTAITAFDPPTCLALLDTIDRLTAERDAWERRCRNLSEKWAVPEGEPTPILLVLRDRLARMSDIEKWVPFSWDVKRAIVEIEKLTAERDAALQSLAAARAETWMPIETAPKDGTPIFVLSKEDDLTDEYHGSVKRLPRAHIANWSPDGWCAEDGKFCDENEIGAVFHQDTGIWSSGGGWFEDDEVTHWQPLPEPPISERAASERGGK